MNVLRSNHDIKVMTHRSETKAVSFYITHYATKKQQASFNSSALLAKRYAYHHRAERSNYDIQGANKRLLQRCCNALTSQQEFSTQEVISYIMGWGDRYESHFFTKIYWTPVL